MISKVFPALFLSGLFGSAAFFAVCLVTKLFFSKSFTAAKYRLLVLCLAITLIPVKITLYRQNSRSDTEKQAVTQQLVLDTNEQAEAGSSDEEASFQNEILQSFEGQFARILSVLSKFSALYVTAALTLLFARLVLYSVFCVKLRKSAAAFNADLSPYRVKNVKVVTSPLVSSPILVYMEKPYIFLPSFAMTAEEIHTCLLHETTHIRNGDFFVKLLCLTSKSVHFYNPLIYLIVKKLESECEICCDMCAVSSLDTKGRKGYISNVLSLAGNAVKPNSLVFGINGSKKDLERRFTMILNSNNPTKRKTAVITALCTIIAICALLAGGVFAGKLIKKESEPILRSVEEGEKITNSVKTADSTESVTPQHSQSAADNTKEPVLVAVKISPVLDSFEISHGYSDNHKAVDYRADKGANVYAGIDGTVSDTGYDHARGIYIDLVSTDGTTVLRYNHLSEVFIQKDSIVTSGGLIGAVGQTGMATGPHLHFEVDINGFSANPEPLFIR